MEAVRALGVSLRKSEQQVDDQNPNQFSLPGGEPAVPQLAEGTRQNIHVQSAKGLRIPTRCQTVERFIATYHPICEDTAIFIPNTRRSVGAITQFAFTLAGGHPVLVGIGAVIEEFTTTENRFGHVGIVISLQQLARGSTSIFDQLLAARAARKSVAVDHTPAPIFARAVTGPVTMADAVKAAAPRSEAAKVQIPNPVDRHDRTKTVIGIAAISKAPAIAIKVPASIAPQAKKPDATPRRGSAKRPAQAAATPVARASALDSNWDAIADQSLDAVPVTVPDASDTVRDVMPYALHHTLGNAAPASPDAAVAIPEATPVAARTADDESEIVTSVSMVDEPALVTAANTADGFETVTAVGTEAEILVFRALSNVGMAAVTRVAPVEPSAIVTDGAPDESAVAMTAASSEPAATPDAIPDELVEASERLNTPAAIWAPTPSPTQIVEDVLVVTSSQPASRRWRWVAAFATLVMLLAATATVTVFVEPSMSTRNQGIESAPARTDSKLKIAFMAASEQDEPDRQADASPRPPVEPPGQETTTQPTTTQPTQVKVASASPTRIAKAPARATAPKVRPRPRPVRRARPKCRSLDCL